MAKPRFFVDRAVKYAVDITGSDARHIRDVLRLRAGEVIEVVDPEGVVSDVEIVNISDEKVTGKVIKSYRPEEGLPEVFLFQALPKGTKMDDIVRKSVEIGVTGIFPMLTERVVVKVEPEKAARKVERWQKIATEAAKQSHRTLIPKVSPVLSFSDALVQLEGFDEVIVFWEEERAQFPYEVLDVSAKRVALVIGPEGGLADSEVLSLKEIGAKIVTLGESILRVETAGPVAIALIVYDLRRLKRQSSKAPDSGKISYY
ncbi:MAG: 16S rRNA (uracil(1498)-N(3))-methyltransferase [Firmicutes bacterium]|nr:16S rRNA (uracil(1498)-N(3))-methyltransferase [Bacillota bacterium]